MKKLSVDILFGGIVYAVYMLISCIVIMFAEILAVKVVNLFIVTEYHLLTVIRAVIYTVGVCAILAVIAYREGYKAARFSIPVAAISGAAASVMHFLFALLFNFEAFSSGGVKFITALFKFGSKLNNNSLTESLTRVDFIPFFFLVSLLYVGIMIGFGKIGEFMRMASRQELTGSYDEADEEKDTKG